MCDVQKMIFVSYRVIAIKNTSLVPCPPKLKVQLAKQPQKTATSASLRY